MNKENEIWKSVIGFEGYYEVSNLGRIKSSRSGKNTFPGRLLHLNNRGRGYLCVLLTKPGIRKTRNIHELVSEAFIGPKPELMCVNHIDGIKGNNCCENLEYVTHSENNKHAFRIGLKSNKGENHSSCKLTEKNVLSIREMASKGIKTSLIASEFFVARRTVSHIIKRTRWSHI